MKRYAVVSAKRATPEVIARYLPANYKVLGVAINLNDKDDDPFGDYSPCVVVQGEDRAGWTLDDYVLPRLGSGLIVGKEIDLSHPVMKKVAVMP